MRRITAKNWKTKRSYWLIAALVLSATPAWAAGTLSVQAPGYSFRDAEYTTSHVFVDEVAGTSAALEIRYDLTAFSNITDVEIFTNVNRRNLARVDKNADGYPDGIEPVDGNVITDSAADTDPLTGQYYAALNMTDGDGDRIYELVIPATKTGAYRLTSRFKTANAIAANGNDPNKWIWYGLRDHAVVVSPVDARDVRLYEINVFNIEATGDTFAQRSTLEDLHNAPGAPHAASNRWDLTYLKNLGMNWLWFQPIHPNGIDGREVFNGSPYEPGSPYAVKNFFEVNELMTANYSGGNSVAQNRSAAMTAWQNFVAAADAEKVGIMLDAPFNHTAYDVELAQKGVDLFQRDGETWSPLDEIRNRDARFFSSTANYGDRSSNAGNIAVAPDRFDFGKFSDTKDVFFGRYDALVEVDSEPERSSYNNEGDWFDRTDSDWTTLDFTQGGQQWNVTRRVWDYFAEYAIYWLEKTRPAGQNRNSTAADGNLTARYAWDQRGIDGLRCDFGQGLPPQAWEYIINVAHTYKWNFVMMAESLDAGAVAYRSNRHFDILNESIVFPLKSATTNSDYRNIFEGRRTAFGQGLVLLNTTSHDEANYVDPWQAVVRTAAVGMMDGATMIFPGQELGLSDTFGYSQYETNFGKQIPHFKRWNSMQPLWNDSDFGNDQLYPVIAGIQSARAASPALRSSNRYFLDGDGGSTKIFAAAKYQTPNVSPALQDVVLGFANLDRDTTVSDNFKIPSGLATLIGLNPTRRYNSKNLAATVAQQPNRRNVWLWGAGYTGAELQTQGFFVQMPKVPTVNADWTTAPYEAQYLKIYDVTPLEAPAGGPTVPDYALDGSVRFSWNAVTDPGGLIPRYRLTVTPSQGPVTTYETSATSFLVTGLSPGITATATVTTLNPNDTSVASAPTSTSPPTVSIASADDFDGDGATNGAEDAAGTDPLSADSILRITEITRLGDSVTIDWDAKAGKSYTVRTSPTLINPVWTAVATGLTIGTYTDSGSLPDAKFYQILLE